MVKLVLNQSVPRLGNRGDIVTVSPGFARNYLIARNMAVMLETSTARALVAEIRSRARINVKAKTTQSKLGQAPAGSKSSKRIARKILKLNKQESRKLAENVTIKESL